MQSKTESRNSEVSKSEFRKKTIQIFDYRDLVFRRKKNIIYKTLKLQSAINVHPIYSPLNFTLFRTTSCTHQNKFIYRGDSLESIQTLLHVLHHIYTNVTPKIIALEFPAHNIDAFFIKFSTRDFLLISWQCQTLDWVKECSDFWVRYCMSKKVSLIAKFLELYSYVETTERRFFLKVCLLVVFSWRTYCKVIH